MPTISLHKGTTLKKDLHTSIITKLRSGVQDAQVASQYSFSMPALPVSPPSNNDLRNEVQEEIEEPDSVDANLGKDVSLR